MRHRQARGDAGACCPWTHPSGLDFQICSLSPSRGCDLQPKLEPTPRKILGVVFGLKKILEVHEFFMALSATAPTAGGGSRIGAKITRALALLDPEEDIFV